MSARRAILDPVKLTAGLAPIVVLILVAVAAKPAAKSAENGVSERYLSPIEMALSPDGHSLYVVCQSSGELRVVDTTTSKVVASVALGRLPRGIALSPDGSQIYVTNADDDTVSVVDTATLKVTRSL
jgi:YVTN family beta-propeller protein